MSLIVCLAANTLAYPEGGGHLWGYLNWSLGLLGVIGGKTMRSEAAAENCGPDRVLAILGYHKVGPPSPGGWETWYYVPERVFARQLTDLRENCWEVIDLATFVAGLAAPDCLPYWAGIS